VKLPGKGKLLIFDVRLVALAIRIMRARNLAYREFDKLAPIQLGDVVPNNGLGA
jgi:hypothetical protein